MPKGDKYLPLQNYLLINENDTVTLTFMEIEDFIGSKLPNSAYKYKAWWGNHKNNLQTLAWLTSEYKVIDFPSILVNKKSHIKKM